MQPLCPQEKVLSVIFVMKFTTLSIQRTFNSVTLCYEFIGEKTPTHPYTIITLDAFGIAIMNIKESIINPTSQFFCIIMQLSFEKAIPINSSYIFPLHFTHR